MSSDTHAVYPVRWKISAAKLNIALEVLDVAPFARVGVLGRIYSSLLGGLGALGRN